MAVKKPAPAAVASVAKAAAAAVTKAAPPVAAPVFQNAMGIAIPKPPPPPVVVAPSTWGANSPQAGQPIVKTPTPPPTPPPDPNAGLIALLKQQAIDAQNAADAANRNRRVSAYETMYAVMKQYGVDVDGTGLAAQIKSWAEQDKGESAILLELRQSQAYHKRFTGMKALMEKGQAISEGEYISQERSYRTVLQNWGLPSGFYDDPTDYGKFIANGLSVKELDDRVKSAKTFLDSADPFYKKALNDLGLSEGTLLAHVLDGDRAQNAVNTEMKQAAFKGAAGKFGFALSNADAAKFGATLGDQFNAIGADQVGALEKTLSSVGEIAKTQSRLAAIDNETYQNVDSLNAELMNDGAAKTAAQKRMEREQARFSGSSGFGAAALQHGTR